jgi:hypothetical protein
MLDHLLDLADPTPLVLPFAVEHSPRPLFFSKARFDQCVIAGLTSGRNS